MNNRTCIICATSFETRTGTTRYCSAECRATIGYRYTPKTTPHGNTRPSPECSDNECERPAHGRGMCRMHYRRWERANGSATPPSDQWNDKRKDHSRKRKAVKRGATNAVTFNKLTIFKRDSWTCGICSEPVDKTLTYPHPMSASLDHIVPLVHGGAHAPQNAQCSHLRCNLIKGDRVASLTA